MNPPDEYQKGDKLTCIFIRPNSRTRLTIGKVYEQIEDCHHPKVINDSGLKQYYSKRVFKHHNLRLEYEKKVQHEEQEQILDFQKELASL